MNEETHILLSEKFLVSYPDLPGCITCGETVENAVANASDAKKVWIEAALEECLHF